MGVNDLLQLAPVQDDKVYESGLTDYWNENVPSMLQFGDTTNIDGKRYGNTNKDFNDDSPEELQTRFSDKSMETPTSNDPYFYKLKNTTTGEIKFGIAPNGLDERYQGQDISGWDVIYNERRSDAVDLEARIHGNKSFLKRRAVDYGLTKNKFGKGATEIYKPIEKEALSKAQQLLEPEQISLLDKVWGGAKIASGYDDEFGQDSPEGRSERMIKNLRDMPLDFGKGMGIGVAKAVGGVASLLGDDYLKEQMQDVATTASKDISSKHNLSATFGEIAPEFILPATLPIKAGVGIGKGIAIGAGSGAVINTGYELLKEQSGIKEGEEASPLLAGGIGAVIGGFFGGVQGRQIAKAFTDGDEAVKTQIVESLDEKQFSHLQEFVRKRQTPKASDSKVVKPEKSRPTTEVQPEAKASTISKTGGKISDSEGMEKLSEVEFDVVKPTKEADETVTEYPITKDVKTEEREARAYYEDGSLLSPAGDTSQKVRLKIRQPKEVVNAEEHVAYKLELFDRQAKIKKAYGKAEASIKEAQAKSSAQIKANRLQYEKDLYDAIWKDKSIKKSVRMDAGKKFNELQSKKVVEFRPSKEAIESATKKQEKQIGKAVESASVRTDREIKLTQQFEHFKKNDKDYQKGWGFAKKEISDVEIQKNIIDIGKQRRKSFNEAKLRVKKAKSLDVKPNPADEYVVRQQEELASDLDSFRKKKIDIDELRYREMLRLEDRLKKDSQSEFEGELDMLGSELSRMEEFSKLGIKTKVRNPEWKKKSKGTYTYKKENDKPRLAQERKAEAYRENPTEATRKKTGEVTLREDEVEKLNEGIDIDLFGRLSSSDKNIKAEAKAEYASIQNKQTRSNMGISDNAKVEAEYIFKDEMTDASNSAFQFISVLMGDKSLAKGTKIMFGGKDFRQVIADKMQIKSSIKKKIVENTKEELIAEHLPVEFGKFHIKPLAMVWAYGSSDKGLIKTFAKDNGLTMPEAEHVFKAFNKVFLDMYPSAKVLRDSIYTLQERNKGAFKWTLPNGTTSSYTAKGSIRGTLGKKDIEIATNKSDMNSRALMPNIIHSIDGYAIQEVAKRLDIPVATVHDAVRTPEGQSDKVLKVYTDIMQEINDSNLLDDIMKELGYRGGPIKKMFGDLSKEDIATGTKKMSPEHTEGEKIKVKQVEIEDEKVKEPLELMNDYMASMDVRTETTTRLLDSIVNEQMYSRTVDAPSSSPYENVIYHAMNGNKFTEKMMVKTPEGVDARLFKSAQRKLFEVARAKLEYNPLITHKVKGNRKYFHENGKPFGKSIGTVNEIIRAERKLAESKKIKKFAEIQKEVYSWKEGKTLTKKQYLKKKLVNDIRIESAQPEKLSHKTAWNIQNSDAEAYVKMRELSSRESFRQSVVNRNAELLHKDLSKIDKPKLKDIEVLAKSDYESIRGITKKQVKTIKEQAKSLPKGIDRHIKASVIGLKNESKQYGFYARNGTEIANRFNLDIESAKLIDQLISIKAMDTNGGWKILEKLGKDKDLDLVMDTMRHKRIISEKELFDTNPEKITKGYIKSVYRGKKELSESGKVQYQLGDVYEKGLLGSELESKRMGTIYKGEAPLFKDSKSEFEFMQENQLRKTGGKYRKVAGDDIRKELGISDDFVESLTETVRATEEKASQKQLVMYTMVENDKGSLLFSNKAKDGFVELTEEQSRQLPYGMRDTVRYINKEMFEPLMGRDEVRLYHGDKRWLMMIDKLAQNFATAFKQNVVLKNPASYLNSFIVNQTLPMTMRINPLTHARFQKEGLKDLTEMNKIVEQLRRSKISGAELDKALQSKLKNNLLYKMERQGLSTNRVEGVLGDDDLLGALLKDGMPTSVYWLAKNLNLSQKTAIGKASIKGFSAIDTTGRYAMVRSLMKKNPKMTMEKAITESNGLYSNMDEMAPAMIEMLDKYPAMPFLKWFSKTTPKLLQISRNNPKTAIAVAIGLYILAQETDLNLSTTNPLEAVIDFAEGQTPFATYDKIEATGIGQVLQNSLVAHTVPKVLVNAWRSPETLGANKLLKKRIDFDPYKGLVQSTIEGDD
ncbi:MAG: hypothetical protein GQ570_08575 [Helicobacteraceae bacterium]|nr:hypothetical protein [Helicobacteraceae bacterium]